MVNLQNLTDDEKYYAARVSDAFETSDTKSSVKIIGFLDEKQKEIARQLALQRHCNNYVLYGGYEDASRTLLGIFPEYVDITQPPCTLFPSFSTITLHYRTKLSHRDFLGALMNLGITRESVGDILVGDGIAVLFVLSTITQIIVSELTKVGNVGVRCEIGRPEILPVEEHFLEIKDTISSLRLDCTVSALTKLSREKASALIKQGLVAQNFTYMQSGSGSVAEGDKISIRGYGKFIVAQVGGLTKKGRIQLVCKKYL